MNIENMAGRVRIFCVIVSLVGAVILIGGIFLLVSTFNYAEGPLKQSWVEALRLSLPAIAVTGLGLLMAVLPWLPFLIVTLLSEHSQEQETREQQLLLKLDNQYRLLEAIKETTSLSDAAKAIAYRQKDREALRQAIREDIQKGDFEAATQLVDEMQERFGYRQEAQELREQIEDGSRAAREQMIQDNIHQIDDYLTKFNWDEAHRLCLRLTRLLPDHGEVRRLPDRIQLAKDKHKRELLGEWRDAVSRDDVNRSVELLKELDQYLSPSEAEAYKESARDVFRKRLQQMGVQFALHVHDKAWSDAVRIGRQITDEFPNTRIAAEVREKMAILMEKANQPAGV